MTNPKGYRDPPSGAYTRGNKARLMQRIRLLKRQGLLDREVYRKLKISQRYYYDLKKQCGEIDTDPSLVDPKSPEEWAPDTKACMAPSAAGFERFFNRYSGHQLARHSRRFVELALGQENVLLNVPPGHAKSEVFSVWMTIWLICMGTYDSDGNWDRGSQILLISKTWDQAQKFTRKIAYELENNADLVADFGRFVPSDSSATWKPGSGQLMVDGRDRHAGTGDLTLLARGAMQGIYGLRATHIICDDIVDTSNSDTPEKCEKLSNWFHTEVESRLTPLAKIIVIGTRFRMDDLYGELASLKVEQMDEDSPPLWRHINFPAVEDWEKGKVLWPEMWPISKLRTIYNKIGSARFQNTYQQEPVPSEDRTVQPAWIYGDDYHQGCLDRDRLWGFGVPSRAGWHRVVSLDPSPSRYAGLIVADVRSTREDWECVVVEVVRRKMSVIEMVQELDRCASYGLTHCIIEVNAAQKWFAQDLRFQDWLRRNRIRLIPHSTGRNKLDDDMGLKSLARDFMVGLIRLPYKDEESQRQTKLLAKEATEHPYGKTTDVFMALWFIKANADRFRTYQSDQPDELGARRFRIPTRLQKTGLRGLVSA